MKAFVDKYSRDIYGVLHGFDRLLIKGYIRDFQIKKKMYYYLSKEGVLLKYFKQYAESQTEKLKKQIEKIAEEVKEEIVHVSPSELDKGDYAAERLKAKGNAEGLICILSTVEPCRTITVRGNKVTRELELRNEQRKCLHYYLYYNDRDFGIMYIRIESWIPFTINVYVNGKEYVKKQLSKENIQYESYKNSIVYCEKLEVAQEKADKLWQKKWYEILDVFASRVNPLMSHIEEVFGSHAYYWCLDECEYASDILFLDRKRLAEKIPAFMEYASICQRGEDIYTFFGRRPYGPAKGEAVSDRKYFWDQGFRVKFKLGKNTLKMYDKSSVLRIETTINNSREFKVWKKGNWLPMKKSISNMYQIADMAQRCNERYIESLALCEVEYEVSREIESLCNSKAVKTKHSGHERKYGSFNPLKESTCQLFYAIMNGAYYLKAFSNKELTKALIGMKAFSKEEIQNAKKLRSKVSRILAKLRAHKLITKFPHTFKYRVTETGAKVISAILIFKNKDVLKVC